MKPEEKIADQFLRKNWNTVIFEPDGNIPPDFIVDSVYAIEVRRLNQNFFNKDGAEALEQLVHPLSDAFKEILESFDNGFAGKTYMVALEVRRPITGKIHNLKYEMINSLVKFLEMEVEIPCEIEVNHSISLHIYDSQLKTGCVFRYVAFLDEDSGGGVVSEYIKNIQYCVSEKNKKVRPYMEKYANWGLILVDYLDWWLDDDELDEIISGISDLGNFNEIRVIRRDGEHQLLNISK